MTRTSRALVTSIGATALAFGAVIGGVATSPLVAAQNEGPTRAERMAEMQQAEAEAYQGFVATMAAELGVANADVDAAIREALKQRIADHLAAGELTVEEAAARSAVIDVTDAPLPLGPGGPSGPGGPGGHAGHGPRGAGPGRPGAFPGGPEAFPLVPDDERGVGFGGQDWTVDDGATVATGDDEDSAGEDSTVEESAVATPAA